jgi:uncharacterized membrane protein YesL
MYVCMYVVYLFVDYNGLIVFYRDSLFALAFYCNRITMGTLQSCLPYHLSNVHVYLFVEYNGLIVFYRDSLFAFDGNCDPIWGHGYKLL